MTDALTEAPAGPSTDVLDEQVETPKPQENMMPAQEDAPEEKSDEAKRSDSVKKAIDKTLEDKPDDKAKDEEPAPKEKPKAKAKEAPKGAENDAPEAKEPQQEPETPEQKPTAYKEAPKGFDDVAKAGWEDTPESVRGAFHRRMQEMESGIERHRQVAQEFEAVRPYAEMARQSGTDLATALQRYTQMEQQLRQNPLQGLQAVVANMGLKKSDGTPITLRDVAANIMGQTPDRAASQQEATISRLTQQVQSLTNQLGGFSKHVETQQQQARTDSAANEWQAFQNNNPRAAELEPQIAEFLTKYPANGMSVGERLQDAYDWAVSRNPSVAHTDNPPLVQTQKEATPNPAGQKSISGAPKGNNTASSRKKPSRSEAIEKAMRAANL